MKVVYSTPTTLDPLAIRRRLGRAAWSPPRRHGPDGWAYVRTDRTGSVIVSVAEHDGHEWVHASIAYTHRMPTYDDLKLLHRAVFGNGWAYQPFAPPSEHINIHNYALHLFGRVDHQPALPDFTEGTGSI